MKFSTSLILNNIEYNKDIIVGLYYGEENIFLSEIILNLVSHLFMLL